MEKTKKIWIFAGEESGDVYGARLAKEIEHLSGDISVSIAGMGGANMKAAGVDILVDSTELGVVGLVEVMGHIFKFIKIFLFLKKRAIKERPDAIVLIDYPGFNLRFAKSIYKSGIPVIWYISPQVWAWASWRIPKLAKVCSKMMVIFPFETKTYAGTDLDVEFVGHPLVEIVNERRGGGVKRDPKNIILLPGSRFNEVDRLFLPMLETVAELYKRDPQLTYTVATPREKIYRRIEEIYREFLQNNGQDSLPEIEIVCGSTSKCLQKAGTGLAASGTVTVECAIAGLPLVVVYKVNAFTYFLGKLVVKIPYFTMINLIANKEVFHEFLQGDVNGQNLANEIELILPKTGIRRTEVIDDMQQAVDKLSGGSEGASKRAAKICLKVLFS